MNILTASLTISCALLLGSATASTAEVARPLHARLIAAPVFAAHADIDRPATATTSIAERPEAAQPQRARQRSLDEAIHSGSAPRTTAAVQ